MKINSSVKFLGKRKKKNQSLRSSFMFFCVERPGAPFVALVDYFVTHCRVSSVFISAC